MSRGYQALEVDETKLQAAMSRTRDLLEFKRYQAVYLRVSQRMPVPQIASITGLSESAIHNLHSRVRREGLSALETKGRGGRYHSHLSVDAEKALLKEMEEKAEAGGMLSVRKIHAAFEQKAGCSITLSTTYRMLDRHGWQKIAPRPRHPKADIKAQEAFKKIDDPKYAVSLPTAL